MPRPAYCSQQSNPFLANVMEGGVLTAVRTLIRLLRILLLSSTPACINVRPSNVKMSTGSSSI